LKGEGREGKREGGIRRTEGREWEGKMKGKGRREREGRIVSEGWCPLNLKFWRRHCLRLLFAYAVYVCL
jgi:hypothetical protein